MGSRIPIRGGQGRKIHESSPVPPHPNPLPTGEGTSTMTNEPQIAPPSPAESPAGLPATAAAAQHLHGPGRHRDGLPADAYAGGRSGCGRGVLGPAGGWNANMDSSSGCCWPRRPPSTRRAWSSTTSSTTTTISASGPSGRCPPDASLWAGPDSSAGSACDGRDARLAGDGRHPQLPLRPGGHALGRLHRALRRRVSADPARSRGHGRLPDAQRPVGNERPGRALAAAPLAGGRGGRPVHRGPHLVLAAGGGGQPPRSAGGWPPR